MKKLVFFAALSCTATMVQSMEPIAIIEPASIDDPAKVELGKKLFFDPRLSKSGVISCNSCHNLAAGGTDNLPTSVGHGWAIGPINSPTVLNAVYNVAQFWDGRAADLQEQAAGPIEAAIEMGSSHELAVQTIASIEPYQKEFSRVFGESGVDIDKITDAIATFEETLVTPNSQFDQWLLGDEDAISAQALAGYELFKTIGCTACHSGPAVGGTSFQKMGLVKPFETDNPSTGRMGVTGNERDLNIFKVPTLRNIELTAPYFHDGQTWELEEAVRIMADIQLARQLEDQQIADIVAFLKTLTGERLEITLPALPPSQANTHKPDISVVSSSQP